MGGLERCTFLLRVSRFERVEDILNASKVSHDTIEYHITTDEGGLLMKG